MIILRTVRDNSSALQLALIHEWKGMSVAGPAAPFTNRNVSVLKVPLHSSQMERTVCCGSLWTKGPCFAGSRCTIHKRTGQCVAGPMALFTNGKNRVLLRVPLHYSKRQGQCAAGPTALFTNGKDGVLRVPSAQGHMDRPQFDLLEDGNGLLMSEAGHRSTVHGENFIT